MRITPIHQKLSVKIAANTVELTPETAQREQGYRSVVSDFRHKKMGHSSDDDVIRNKRRDSRSDEIL